MGVRYGRADRRFAGCYKRSFFILTAKGTLFVLGKDGRQIIEEYGIN